MDVDRARIAVGAVAPDPLQQRGAVEDVAGAARQGGEDLELDVGELGPLAADRDLPAGRSTVISPATIGPSTGSSPLNRVRRSAAFTRLRNSRTLNGLVM